MATEVTPTQDAPQYHLSLGDGTTTLGFILVDSRGKRDERAIRRFGQSRTALKTAQGSTKYSDLEPPYQSIAQDDWSGGRGNEDADDDKSRFFDSYRLDSLRSDALILGGLASYAMGHRSQYMHMPGSSTVKPSSNMTGLTWTALSSADAYLEHKFQHADGFITDAVEIWIKNVGDPEGDLTVTLHSDSGGDPDTQLKLISVDNSIVSDSVGVLYKFVWPTTQSLTAATDYHIRIYDDGTPTATSYWAVGVNTFGAATYTQKSTNGSSWSAADNDLFIRVIDADADFIARFFEYKGQMYYATQPDAGGAGSIYMNGYRGQAQSNSGDKTKLNDALQTGWADDIVDKGSGDAVAVIFDGEGSTEPQDWRDITAATSGVLTCSPAWNVAHVTSGPGSTIYNILGTNAWTLLETGTYPFVGVEPTGEVVWLCSGEGRTKRPIYKFREHSDTYRWVRQFGSEPFIQASFIKAIYDPNSYYVMWLGRNNDADGDVTVTRSIAPQNFDEPLATIRGYHSITPKGFMREQFVNDIASDTFDGGDGAMGDTDGNVDHYYSGAGGSGVTWVVKVGNWGILSNQAYAGTLAGGLAIVTVPAGMIDVGLGVQITVNGGKAGVVVRYADTDNYVYATHDGTNLKLTKRVGGNETDLIDLTDVAYVAGASIGIRCCGTQFGLMYNWRMEGDDQTISDAGLQTGQDHGMYTTDITNRFDDYIMVDNTVEVHVNSGANSARISVSSEFAGTAILASDVVDAEDWRGFSEIQMTIRSTLALAAGDLKLYIDNTALAGSPISTTNFPAMLANVTYHFLPPNLLDMTFDLTATSGADTVRSVALYLTNSPAAVFQIHVSFSFLKTDTERVLVGNRDDKITNMIPYDDPETLWVLKQGSVWKIDADTPYKVPLNEMAGVKSSDNGRAAVVSDVYLYFSLQHGVERYFRQNLDDVGPNRDAGLPSGRQGPVVDMVAYPGRIFAAVDGGTAGTSSVLVTSGVGWHEVYRAPRTGERIRKIYIQSIPGSSTARLWISQGSDVLWVPISLNPYYDADYQYVHEGTLTSSWFYAGMRDIVKVFKSLKLFCEDVSSNAITVEADYQTDGSSTWTVISGAFDTVPVEELDLSSATPPNVTGRRLRYRLRLQSNAKASTPRIKATVLESYGVAPVKYGYSFAAKLTEDDLSIDLEGDEGLSLGQYARVETALAKLDAWAADLTPLIMGCVYSPYDSKTVVLDTPATQPLRALFDDQIEEHIMQITVNET